jgi:hypothetical protein
MSDLYAWLYEAGYWRTIPLPYCWKCGTRLDENAQYCPVCGAPLNKSPAAASAQQARSSTGRYVEMRRGWSPLAIVGVVLIAVLAVALLAGILIFAPVRSASFGPEVKSAPRQGGVDSVNLVFNADIGRCNVTFGDLDGNAVVINVSASGSTGLLTPSQPLNFTLDYSRAGHVLYVNSSVRRTGVLWQPFMIGLNVVCDIMIDRGSNLSVDVSTSAGSIDFAAGQGVILDLLNLEAVTGSVDASLWSNVIVNGAVQAHSTTGSVDFSWTNLRVMNNLPLNVGTTTGSVNLDITQDNVMGGEMTVDAGTVTGGVNLNLNISNGVGALINSSTDVGSIKVNATNFGGNKSPIQSSNYPAQSNFAITLRTTTGGINIMAAYSTSIQS